MRILLFSILALVFALAQAVLFREGWYAPNLAVVLVVFIGLYVERRSVLPATMAACAVVDVLSGTPLGAVTLAGVVLALLLIVVRESVFRGRLSTLLVLTGVCAVVFEFVVGVVIVLRYGAENLADPALRMSWCAVYTTAVALPLLFPLHPAVRLCGARAKGQYYAL